jgi:hypothetical protein
MDGAVKKMRAFRSPRIVRMMPLRIAALAVAAQQRRPEYRAKLRLAIMQCVPPLIQESPRALAVQKPIQLPSSPVLSTTGLPSVFASIFTRILRGDAQSRFEFSCRALGAIRKGVLIEADLVGRSRR